MAGWLLVSRSMGFAYSSFTWPQRCTTVFKRWCLNTLNGSRFHLFLNCRDLYTISNRWSAQPFRLDFVIHCLGHGPNRGDLEAVFPLAVMKFLPLSAIY